MPKEWKPCMESRKTANYLGEIFKDNLKGKNFKNLHIEVVTSELNDELRREKITEMNKSERRLLIATDCLSEGINLQEGFNALLHYDLPWNPNRLEQRIHRIGQTEVCRLWNIIAHQTREGEVWQRLFDKLEIEREALRRTGI